jgi:hypothetical protein
VPITTRARQIAPLFPPTVRATTFLPVLISGALGVGYVLLETGQAYIGYRILVLRIAALLICFGAAFAFDDPAEDALASVPTPLILRRMLRIALVLPFAAGWWFLCLFLAGEVPPEQGGPMPVGDLTLEAGVFLTITFVAAALGSLFTSDRLGGVVAAPILIAFAVIGMVLPGDYRLVVAVPDDLQWIPAHDAWRRMAWGAAAALLYLSQDRGRYSLRFKLRRALGSGISLGPRGKTDPSS